MSQNLDLSSFPRFNVRAPDYAVHAKDTYLACQAGYVTWIERSGANCAGVQCPHAAVLKLCVQAKLWSGRIAQASTSYLVSLNLQV